MVLLKLLLDNTKKSLYKVCMNKIIHFPESSRVFIKNKSVFRSQICNILTDYFTRWGFFPVELPVLDYYDIYSEILTDNQKRESYRFTDRNGDLLLLRNDLTLFAARLVATRSVQDNSSIKYYYRDSILRNEQSGNSHELFQIGCEIVSDKFNLEEFEVFLVILDSLRELNIENFQLHIGDLSIFKFLDRFTDDKKILNSFINSFRNKDLPNIKLIFEKLKVEKAIQNDIFKLFQFTGSYEELIGIKLETEISEYLTSYFENAKNLDKAGYSDFIIYDFSELPGSDYYSGLYFNVYCSELEVPLLTGGRYDKLFEKFSLKKNAIGFTYWLESLERILYSKLELKADEIRNFEISANNPHELLLILDHIKTGGKVNVKYR